MYRISRIYRVPDFIYGFFHQSGVTVFLTKTTNKVNKQICMLETIRTENLFGIYVSEVQTDCRSLILQHFFTVSAIYFILNLIFSSLSFTSYK